MVRKVVVYGPAENETTILVFVAVEEISQSNPLVNQLILDIVIKWVHFNFEYILSWRITRWFPPQLT